MRNPINAPGAAIDPPEAPTDQQVTASQQNAVAPGAPIPTSAVPNSSPEGMPVPGPQVFESDDDPNIYVSNWTNFMTNAANAAQQSSVVDLYRSVRNTIDQANTSTPVLGQEQIAALQKDRPGINFPENVRQSTANSIVNNYDAQTFRNNILDHSQPTIAGGITGWAGGAVGSIVTDPVAAAMAGLTGAILPEVAIPDAVSSTIPETLGVDSGAMRNALVDRTISRFGKGMFEGAAFSATQSGAKKIEDETNGDTFDAFNAALSLGDNMFLGGAIHSVGAFIPDAFRTQRNILEGQKAFGEEASADAAQSSASSIAQGKDPQPEVPLQNGLAQHVQELHGKMAQSNVSNSDMLDALDAAKENIETAQSENTASVDDLNNTIGDAAPTDDQQAELSSLNAKQTDLQMRSQAQEVYRHMVESPQESLTKPQLDDYVNNFQNPQNDYANGIGQENLGVTGEPIQTESSLLNDQFPDEYKQELLEGANLTSDEQDSLTEINKRDDRTSALKTGIDRAIQCLSGVPNG